MQHTQTAITNEVILTAGPYIDYREVEYCADAARNGWNNHHSDYIHQFEKTFFDYIGVKYGFSTSSCTGALHLMMLAAGIGPGDEVIVPETSWIATASAIVYVGAKPVFCDIKADTWVMDSDKLEALITPKTKAIIPVHLYGQPVDMDPVLAIAQKHNIFVLEDSAPAIGTEYKGKKTGSMGHAAAYSFQGAKALVTGEGGILVTNSEEFKNRAWFMNDHGRDPNKALFNIAIGYKYKMSNVQAALGLAQVQKAEEIVAKKRKIFSWYQDRLGDIDNIKMNVEKPETRNIFWMSSIVLGPSIKYERDEFIKELKARNIDSRPMFYPMSSFPMFDNADNPVAYSVPLRGINLPSGHDRTEEEVDYICAHIRELLGKGIGKTSAVQPTGVLLFRDKIENLIKAQKENPEIIQLNDGFMESVSINDRNPQSIALLASWRDKVKNYFPSQFKVTEEGTKRWLDNALLNANDRSLFWVCDKSGKKLGHVGLFRFDYLNKACELDNVVRGEEGSPGIIGQACQTLIDIAKSLSIENIYLRVLSDNKKALKLYEKLGFEEIQRSPVQKVKEKDSFKWIDVIKSPYQKVEQYFVTMKLKS